MAYCDTESVLQAPNIWDMADLVDKIYAVGALAFDIQDSKVILALDLHIEVDNADLLELRVFHVVAFFHLLAEIKGTQVSELFFV